MTQSTANPLSQEQVDAIRKDFDFFDLDKDGEINLKEFVELLTILSPKTKASHVEEGFNLIDSNGDGSIDFNEFLAWWQECWWEY
ncbi:MAG: EF-hand domain-containing protein [Pseudomonadota bacterium]